MLTDGLTDRQTDPTTVTLAAQVYRGLIMIALGAYQLLDADGPFALFQTHFGGGKWECGLSSLAGQALPTLRERIRLVNNTHC